MKKLITVFLLLALILPVAAFADLPDISELTQDELIELNHQIQTKLFNEKLIDGVIIPVGIYTIGEDIPEGVYRIELSQSSYTSIIIINSENNEKIIGSYPLGDTYGAYEIGKLPFEKDQVIEIKFSPVVFYPYSGLFN